MIRDHPGGYIHFQVFTVACIGYGLYFSDQGLEDIRIVV